MPKPLRLEVIHFKDQSDKVDWKTTIESYNDRFSSDSYKSWILALKNTFIDELSNIAPSLDSNYKKLDDAIVILKTAMQIDRSLDKSFLNQVVDSLSGELIPQNEFIKFILLDSWNEIKDFADSDWLKSFKEKYKVPLEFPLRTRPKSLTY